MKKWSFWAIVLGGIMTFTVVAAIWGSRRYQEVQVIEEKAEARLKRAEAKLTAGVKRFMKDRVNSSESQEAVHLLKKVEGELQKKGRPNGSESQKTVKLLKKIEGELQKLEPTPSPEK